MELRYYQQEAREATWQHLFSRDNSPCVVLPTGSGKTPLLAALTNDAVKTHSGKVLIVSHVKELIEQSTGTLKQWFPKLDVGIYSAGLGARDTDHDVVACGIQSVYQRAFEFGERKLVIVDECHLISPKSSSMYQQFFDELRIANPKFRTVGLTATPYRTTSGAICSDDGMLNEICYTAEIANLIELGFLCPITNQPGSIDVDTSKIKIRQGEFAAGELQTLMDEDNVVIPACEEIVALTHDRSAILIFTSGIYHGQHVTRVLNEMGLEAEFVCGDTLPLERAGIIDRFREGRLRCLVNVNVLTTGFDARQIDCVAILRPTCSPGLFYQMAGRGFRLHESKTECLLLDYGGNLQRHGCLDDPEYGKKSNTQRGGGGSVEMPMKTCMGCGTEVPIGTAICQCGLKFHESTMPNHDRTADTQTAVIGSFVEPEWSDVESISYSIHKKRGAPDAPPTMRVDYWLVGRRDLDKPISEWVCIEHEGYARDRAWDWWTARSRLPFPESVEDAVGICQTQGTADTRGIFYGPDKKNPKFTRISDYNLGEAPDPDEWRELQAGTVVVGDDYYESQWTIDEDDLPF